MVVVVIVEIIWDHTQSVLVRSGLVRSGRSSPVRSGPVPVRSGPVRSGPGSGPVSSGPVLSGWSTLVGPVREGEESEEEELEGIRGAYWSGPVRYGSIQSGPVWLVLPV